MRMEAGAKEKTAPKATETTHTPHNFYFTCSPILATSQDFTILDRIFVVTELSLSLNYQLNFQRQSLLIPYPISMGKLSRYANPFPLILWVVITPDIPACLDESASRNVKV